jgi:hypothetical protein
MELIRKVSSKFTHELLVCRIQLLFEWLEGLRSIGELPFDNFRMAAVSLRNVLRCFAIRLVLVEDDGIEKGKDKKRVQIVLFSRSGMGER